MPMDDPKLVIGDLVEDVQSNIKGLVTFFYSECHITVYYSSEKRERIHSREELRLLEESPGRKHGMV